MPCHRLSFGALFLVLAVFAAGLALTYGSAALVLQRDAAIARTPGVELVHHALRSAPSRAS
jgi:hypothetical protein